MGEARTHNLDCWPTYFDAVKNGDKPWEVRKNDRFFQMGDTVVLARLDEDRHFDQYYNRRGETLTFTIGCLLQGGQFGIEPGYCVFTLEPPTKAEG